MGKKARCEHCGQTIWQEPEHRHWIHKTTGYIECVKVTALGTSAKPEEDEVKQAIEEIGR